MRPLHRLIVTACSLPRSVVPQGHQSLLPCPLPLGPVGLALTDLMQGVANVVIKLNTSVTRYQHHSFLALPGAATTSPRKPWVFDATGCGGVATTLLATFWGLTMGTAQTFAFTAVKAAWSSAQDLCGMQFYFGLHCLMVVPRWILRVPPASALVRIRSLLVHLQSD